MAVQFSKKDLQAVWMLLELCRGEEDAPDQICRAYTQESSIICRGSIKNWDQNACVRRKI